MMAQISSQKVKLFLICTGILMIMNFAPAKATNPQNLPQHPIIKAQLSDSVSTGCAFVPERKDDFAWENDLIAFRAYGPALRNSNENAGIDCWLKRVKYPIIKKWYRLAREGISYHQDHGEGLDNYHVGASAGSGGTALWLAGRREALETFVNWKIIKQSPEHSEFVLYYEKKINQNIYREEKHISIETGKRLFKVYSVFSKDGQPLKNFPISVGLTTHNGRAETYKNFKNGRIACWETIEQSGLGTAVLMNPETVQEIIEIDSRIPDESHLLFIAKTDENAGIRYYAGYGWEKAGEILTVGDWLNYLDNFAKSEVGK